MENIEPTKLSTKENTIAIRRNSGKIHNLKFRAKLPIILRGLALIVLLVAVLGIGFAFYKGSAKNFVLKGGPTQLSRVLIFALPNR